MTPLFNDTHLAEEYNSKGYVIIRLLSPKQIDELLQLYSDTIDPVNVSGLFESSRNSSKQVNERINQALLHEMNEATSSIFSNSKLYGGTFMVKSHRDSDMLPLHQDWSIVEEDLYNTMFIWCALTPVNPNNGGLFVLEGSHRYFNGIRSGTYPSDRYFLPPPLHRITKNIFLEPGEAIIYSDKLFHGSHANRSNADRVVVTGRVMEADAPLVWFQKANNEEVDVYKVDEDFYLSNINDLAKGIMPRGVEKLYRRHYRHTVITEELLAEKIKMHFPLPSAKSQNLFKDLALQQAFDKNGYVVLDILNNEQVQDLKQFYHSLNHAPVPGHGFQVSLDNQQPEFVQKVAEKIFQMARPSIDKYFQDYQLFTASFVVKAKNPLGVVPPHQDWSFVEEPDYWSATIWCPLVDVHMDNGGLGVISGSHRWYDHVRPSPSPQFQPPFKDQLHTIFPFLNIIDLKAGQALMFNNQTVHGSPPNASEETRISFGIGITHKDAGLRHYFKIPGKERELIEGFIIPPEFFYEYNNARLSKLFENGEGPIGFESLGVCSLEYKKYSSEELVEKMTIDGNQINAELIEKMTRIFGEMYNKQGAKKEEEKKLPWWKVYTPVNVYREIRYRLSK